MELDYTIQLATEKHIVKVTCICGKCSLLSTAQLIDLRNKIMQYKGKDSPEEIKIIDN